MTDAEELATYARQHFSSTIGEAESVEEIGRALISRATAGPRPWAGIRILRSLGILIDGNSEPS